MIVIRSHWQTFWNCHALISDAQAEEMLVKIDESEVLLTPLREKSTYQMEMLRLFPFGYL